MTQSKTAKFRCPKCQLAFRVESRFFGRLAKCPKCDQKIRLTVGAESNLSSQAAAPLDKNSSPVNRSSRKPSDLNEVAASRRIPAAVENVPTTSKPRLNRTDAPSVPPVSKGPPHQRPGRDREAASRVEARRAARKVVRRKSGGTVPRVTEKNQGAAAVSPAWLGFGAAVLVGLVGWTAYAMLPLQADAAATKSSALVDSDPVDDNFNAVRDGSTLTQPSVKLASLPAESAEEVAARRAAEQHAAELAQQTKILKDQVIPYLNTYCSDCHGSDLQEAGIRIDGLASLDQLLSERKSWERVYRMINAGIMPPSDYEPRPESQEQQHVADFLHQELYNFDCELVYNPGRSTVQRLNRSEYNNTVQDLFGIEISPADNFPADDVGEGFDNIGDVLSLPPLLLEKYLNAADEVVSAVIDTTDYSQPRTIFAAADELQAVRGSEGMSQGFRIMASTDELFHEFDVRAAGDYEIRVTAGADQAGDEKAKFALRLGDQTLEEFSVQEHRQPEKFQRTETLPAGKIHIGVAFLNDYYNEKEKGRKDRNLGVAEISLHGPLNGGTPVWSEQHQEIVTARPQNGRSVMDAATVVLRPIMKRAFRRSVSDQEVFRYAGLVRDAVEEMSESYDAGISLALQAILVAPDFLFRLEREPATGESERLLDDFEVASRLSYFLWSSMPDDELLDLATAGQLNNPETLRQQISRMLKDERAEALVRNFAGQWLNLRNLDEVTPDRRRFKAFDDKLRIDMRRETEMLFSTVMQEDRSIEELLSADFTFVNQRLAKHYGIKGVQGDEFQRVSLNGTNRAGVLTHASILTLTSNPSRTSPVKRGKWILDNIFGESPPPPPPGVPELEETAKGNPKASLREQLAKHREDPGCAACHKVMDPLGLGLENFDPIGQWRDKDGKHKIDASGSLPSGETFDGPVQLIDIIKNRRDKFFRTMSEKMLVYAIGRGTEYYDKCTVDHCQELLKSKGYRFSALIEGIVLSDPFLKKRGVF